MTTRLRISTISASATRLATDVLDRMLNRSTAASAWVPWLQPPLPANSPQTPLLGFTRMLANAAKESRRSHLGLEMAAFEEHQTHSLFKGLYTYAPTLGEALRSMAHYFPVSQTGTSIGLSQAHGTAHLVYQIDDPAVNDRLQDAVYTIGKIYRSIRCCTNAGWRPEHVTVAAPAPTSTEAYQHFFRAPVTFGASTTGLHFSAQALEQPIPTADASRFRDFCARLEQSMPAQDGPELLSDALKIWLGFATRDGQATLEHAAANFSITPRTLQRRLKEQGVGFQNLLTQVRMETAQRLLRESKMPVTAIAEQLGFSETSAFTRAFQGHARQSPRAFRHAPMATA